MNLRIPVLLIVASSCLYCSAARQRESRTSASVGGGYLRAGDSSYGCGGELISTQDHRQSVGSLGVEHEGESGFNAAVEVAAGSGEVVAFTSRSNNQQAPLAADTRLPNYRVLAGHARVGYDLAWIGAELGIQVLGGQIGALPYGLLRVGNLDQGLSLELQAGQRRAVADASLATFGAVYKTPETRVKLAAGLIGRQLQRYEQAGLGLRAADWIIGSFSNGLDPGVIMNLETWLDERLAVRVGAVLGEQWGGTIDLVMALTAPGADRREIRMRAQPLDGAEGPAEPPVAPGELPPPAEPAPR